MCRVMLDLKIGFSEHFETLMSKLANFIISLFNCESIIIVYLFAFEVSLSFFSSLLHHRHVVDQDSVIYLLMHSKTNLDICF